MDNAIKSAEVLTQIIDSSINNFESINEKSWNNEALANKWSKKEILGHLCDSAMNNIRRFIVSQYEKNNIIIYKQDDWVASQDYQSENYQNIILL